MSTRLPITQLALVLLLGLLGIHVSAQPPGGPDSAPSYSLAFEAFLKKHPANEASRETALRWYRNNSRMHYKRLRYHTFQMIQYHPSNREIYEANISVYYSHPGYRLEVISLLEISLYRKRSDQFKIYTNLANICEDGAIPPPLMPARRIRFCTYMDLPPDVMLPRRVNLLLAYKAIRYFRKATEAPCRADSNLNAIQLAQLLRELGRIDEALRVCEKTMPHVYPGLKSWLLLTYGLCLRSANRSEEAEQILKKVRQFDDEWFNGPGTDTMRADIQLGLLALHQGDTATASQYLLSSVQVHTFHIRNGADGLPIGFQLARLLYYQGRHKEVATWCRIILKQFWPNQNETKALLFRSMKDYPEPGTQPSIIHPFTVHPHPLAGYNRPT